MSEQLAVFGAGVASAVSPCVAPLVPAYVAMISSSPARVGAGDEAARVAAPASTDGRAGIVRDAVIFVAGFSAVFASFGALVAVASGAVDRSRDVVSRVGGGLLLVFGIALALSAAGLARMPALRPFGDLVAPAHGVARPLIFGITFGAAWTPCAGPLLGAALVASAQVDTAASGAFTLLIYSFGVGLPFVAIALAISVAPTRPIRLGRAAQRLQLASAMVMVVLGLLVISGRVDWLTGRTAQLIDAVI